jgi:putative transposase
VEEQTTRKSDKFKLKPTPEQERTLDRMLMLMLCRHVHNAARGERKAAYLMRRVSVTYYQQNGELPGIKEALPEYREVASQVLQDVVMRVDCAFQAFFRRMKHGEMKHGAGGKKPGYPRFQGRHRFNSFTYPQYDNGVRLDNGFLVLSKIGRVVVRWSRPIEGTPKTVTISRAAAGCYVCIACADVPGEPLALTGQVTGIAVGREAFAPLADSTMMHNPRCSRKAERHRKTAQRRVSRRKKGSKRRTQAVPLLAKAHQQVRRQRQDLHHKAALHLVRAYDTIFHEALQVANMLTNHHRATRATSIADAGGRGFLSILTFTAAGAGKRVVAVNPAYTSQTCSGCGVVVKMGLSVRWHACPDGGTRLHRDHNAVLNMLRLGKQESGDGQSPQALTWPDGSSVA